MTKENFIKIFIITILTFSIYSNSLNNDFVYDDLLLIVNNPIVKSYSNIPAIFTHHFFHNSGFESNITFYRPITTLSYLFNYKLFGLSVFSFHFFNIILHIINATLLFFFAKSYIFHREKDADLTAFIMALLYSAHPIHTESVSFISGRTDLLATTFIFSSMILFFKWYQNNRFKFMVLSVVFYLLALFSKELSLVMPIIIFLILLWREDKPIKEFIKYNYKKMILGLTPFLFLSLIYLLIRFYVVKLQMNDYPTGSFYTTFLLMNKVFLYYIKLMFLPINLIADYNDYFKIPIGLDFESVSAIALNLLLIIFFSWALFKKKYWGLGFCWFLITLLPVLNLIPVGMICAERYLYLPSVGFYIIISYIITRLNNKKFIVIILLMLLSFYSYLTLKRNNDWENQLSIWQSVLKKNPRDTYAHINIAKTYINMNNYEEAEKHITISLKAKPNFMSNKQLEIYAQCLTEKGDYDKALEQLNKISKIYPNYYNHTLYIGDIYLKKNELGKAKEKYLFFIKQNPNTTLGHERLIRLYMKQNDYNSALKVCEDAAKINPDSETIYVLKGYIFQTTNKFNEAINAYNRALEINPKNYNTHYNLGFCFDTLSETNPQYRQSAITEYETALKYKPNSSDIMINLGILYIKNGEKQKAKSLWEKAMQFDKNNQDIINNLKLLNVEK